MSHEVVDHNQWLRVSAACCLTSLWAYLAPTAVLVTALMVWGASASPTRRSSPRR